MALIVVRNESVYQCDVCTRSIRVPTNREGLDVLTRCNITYGCQGKLHRITLAKDINDTPAFPPEVEGLQDWFQRKVLYTHDQPVQAATWLVTHDLANKPVLHVYVNRVVDGVETLVSTVPKTTTTIDLNNTQLTFEVAESGLVQCVALSSQNATNPGSTDTVAPSTAAVQITGIQGELTIATLVSTPLIGVTLGYVTSSADLDVDIEYTSVDDVASVDSPWVGTSTVLINGKKYTVRSFNLTTAPLAPAYFAAGQVPNGSAFSFLSVAGVAPTLGQCLILLGTAPYASVDRVYDQYIDVSAINAATPETFYTTGAGFAYPAVIKSTYPPILVVA